MSVPLALAMATMVLWGLWAIFAKLASRTVEPEFSVVLSYVAAVVITGVYLLVWGDTVSPTLSGSGYSIAAGVVSGLGSITLYVALSKGSAASVTTISALYFVVAAVIGALWLGESVGVQDAIGVVLAVLSIVLIAR